MCIGVARSIGTTSTVPAMYIDAWTARTGPVRGSQSAAGIIDPADLMGESDRTVVGYILSIPHYCSVGFSGPLWLSLIGCQNMSIPGFLDDPHGYPADYVEHAWRVSRSKVRRSYHKLPTQASCCSAGPDKICHLC
jgi:hypothetical protein